MKPKPRRSLIVLCLLVHAPSLLGQAEPYRYPFQNPNLALEDRITNILSLMTLDEKIAALSTHPDVPRLGIKGSGHLEGLHGLALGGPGGWGGRQPIPTTQFPQAVGLGETWDPELLKEIAGIEGYEARYVFQSPQYQITQGNEARSRGGLVIRAPNADLARDPRWGRSEESYGEDPYLTGTLAAAFVHGLQGDDPKYWLTAALLKHFLANSNEDGRGGSSSNFDARLLREYYSVPFRMGIVSGGARAYMTAYNAYNGVPMTVQPILRDITEKDWGFDGIICTDAGALTNMVTLHKYYPDLDHAAAGALHAGINQFLDKYQGGVEDALKEHLVTEADIDGNLRGVFRDMIRLGLLDSATTVPYANIRGSEEPWKVEAHKRAARRAAQESIVLLKNSANLLPLNTKNIKSIAVIGPYADQVLLDWYSGTPPYTVSPLEGIKNGAGSGIRVGYAPDNTDGAAVDLAHKSDVAIVVVGNHPTCNAGWNQCPLPSDGKEAIDRKSITLEQEDLVKQVYGANPKTVVVLLSSFPYAIQWTQDHVPAIVHMAHNSQEEGNALADVLFGLYNPAGRLVTTWPASLDQLPPMMDYNLRNGRTYLYLKSKPLYPFGYGLSYSSFEYSHLRTSFPELSKAGKVRAPAVKSDALKSAGTSDDMTISVDVKNTGSLQGDEVVQLYVQHLDSKVERPREELKAFKRITLLPHETKTVRLPLSVEALSYWNERENRFVVERESVKLMVGASSNDIRLSETINVAPPSGTAPARDTGRSRTPREPLR